MYISIQNILVIFANVIVFFIVNKLLQRMEIRALKFFVDLLNCILGPPNLGPGGGWVGSATVFYMYFRTDLFDLIVSF